MQLGNLGIFVETRRILKLRYDVMEMNGFRRFMECGKVFRTTERMMETLRLYKSMMRAGSKFGDYNFREFALRRVRIGFRMHMGEKDPEKVKSLLGQARDNLALLQRQATVSQFYHTGMSVME